MSRVRYGNRGKWLEAAVTSTGLVYQDRGQGYIEKLATPTRQLGPEKFIRVRGSVDFIGHHEGLPIAFDAKLTRQASLPHANVKPHQLVALDAFARGGGIGFLLVCFERLDISGTYLVHPRWYESQKLKNWPRASISSAEFKAASSDTRQLVVAVEHGGHGVPVDFGPAAWRLKALVDGQDLRNGLQKNKVDQDKQGSGPAG